MCVPFSLRIFSSQSPKKLMEVREDLHPFLRLRPFSLIAENFFCASADKASSPFYQVTKPPDPKWRRKCVFQYSLKTKIHDPADFERIKWRLQPVHRAAVALWPVFTLYLQENRGIGLFWPQSCTAPFINTNDSCRQSLCKEGQCGSAVHRDFGEIQ